MHVCVCARVWRTGHRRGSGDEDCIYGLSARRSQVFANTHHPVTSPDSPHVASVPAGAKWSLMWPPCSQSEDLEDPVTPGNRAWLNMHGHQLQVKSNQTCSHMLLTVGGRGCDLIKIWKHAQEDYWQSITKHTPPPILFISDAVVTWLYLAPQINACVGSHPTQRLN